MQACLCLQNAQSELIRVLLRKSQRHQGREDFLRKPNIDLAMRVAILLSVSDTCRSDEYQRLRHDSYAAALTSEAIFAFGCASSNPSTKLEVSLRPHRAGVSSASSFAENFTDT